MSAAGLSVRGLVAGYGPIRVLDGIDIEARAGRLTVIVGPNGAGKTTLLRAISGLIPREGEVVFDGAPLPRTAEALDAPAGQWPAVAVAWLLVMAPLGWGVYNTMALARRLFTA